MEIYREVQELGGDEEEGASLDEIMADFFDLGRQVNVADGETGVGYVHGGPA